MKLQIEKWVENNKPFDDGGQLFSEAVLCYKVGAYRSAFLMSYLAFKITIKNRILTCTYRPETYQGPGKEMDWKTNVIDPLKLDDKWESHLNKIIEGSVDPQSKSDTRAVIFFNNRARAKERYSYWREVRNECAHAKKSTIDSSTVESFWNYIRDNLSEFYVLGGKDYLVERLFDYYKYRDIEESETKNLLIYDINIVFKENAEDFFDDFFVKLKNVKFFLIDSSNTEFWEDIINSEFEELQIGLVKSLMKDSNDFFSFYSFFPKVLSTAIAIDRRFIRDTLAKWLESWMRYRDENQVFWNVLCDVLDEYAADIDLNKVAKMDLEVIEKTRFDQDMIEILKRNKVFNKFILNSGSYFFEVGFDDIKDSKGRKEEEILYWFQYIEWDEEIIKTLNSAFVRLRGRIERSINSYYTSWETTRKEMYSDLIRSYKEKIDKEMFDKLDLDSEFKSFIISEE